MINSLYFDPQYFFKKTSQTIQPDSLDEVFNNIAGYINTILIPIIEKIDFTATQGEGGYPFAVFCNIDDEDVGYIYIQDLNIDDNLISLDKIEKIKPGSVLGSTVAGEIFAITPTDNNQLLFIGALDENDIFADQSNMEFRKIQSSDILANTFTGQQLGILNINNFSVLDFITLIPDNSITLNMIQPSIQAIKIADNAVDFNSLGKWSLLTLPFPDYLAGTIQLNDFDDGSISALNILDGSIPWSAFSDPNCIKGINLQAGSIENKHLYDYNEDTQPVALNPTRDQLINQKTWGAIINFPQASIYTNLQLGDYHIAEDRLTINNFTPDIQKAMKKIINPPPLPISQPVAPNPVYIPINAVPVTPFSTAVILKAGLFALIKADDAVPTPPLIPWIDIGNISGFPLLPYRFWWYYLDLYDNDLWRYLPRSLAIEAGSKIPGYAGNLGIYGLREEYIGGYYRSSDQPPPFQTWRVSTGTPFYG